MVAVNDVIALRVTPLVTKNKILVGSTFNLSGGAEISPAGELCLRCVGDGTLTLWYSNQG